MAQQTQSEICLLYTSILNDEVIFYQRIEAYELVDARNNGNLKGVLRNIAVGLNEESNPIIMLVKDKY